MPKIKSESEDVLFSLTKLNLEPDVRNLLDDLLSKHPKRAEEIQNEINKQLKNDICYDTHFKEFFNQIPKKAQVVFLSYLFSEDLDWKKLISLETIANMNVIENLNGPGYAGYLKEIARKKNFSERFAETIRKF
ncbi:MAG: hypothetical protein ACP5MC_03400 [Candidatus Micrarchaeia archaeon]